MNSELQVCTHINVDHRTIPINGEAKKILFPFISVLFGVFLSIILLEVIFRVLPVHEGLMILPVNSTNPIIRFKEDRDVTWSHGATFSIITKKHVKAVHIMFV